jgi:hypothetical protein
VLHLLTAVVTATAALPLQVILNKPSPEHKVEDQEFEPNEVYAIDIVVSSGEDTRQQQEGPLLQCVCTASSSMQQQQQQQVKQRYTLEKAGGLVWL